MSTSHNFALTPSSPSPSFSSSSPSSTTSSEPFTPDPQDPTHPCSRLTGTWGPRPNSISDLLNTPTVSDADDDDDDDNDAQSIIPFNHSLTSSADNTTPVQTSIPQQSSAADLTLVGLIAIGGGAGTVAVEGGPEEVIDVDAEPAIASNSSGVKRVAEVVSLLSEDEEAERQQRRKRRRRCDVEVATVVLDGGEGEAGGGEVEMVSHVVRGEKEGGQKADLVAEEWADGGGDVVCTGSRRGVRALRDYPHFRFQCEVVAEKGGMAFCERCFCYVCDVPVGECREWALHYEAVEMREDWKRMREMRLWARKR